MNRRWFALVALTAITLAPAAPAARSAEAPAADGLESADCRQALDSLQAQENAAVAAPQPDGQPRLDARLQALRRQAARACLGGNGDPQPAAQHLAQPPIVVPPIGAVRPLPQPGLAPAPPAPPPAPARAPAVITGCDAIGCWASDGSRLTRVGPNLLGRSGLCTTQAGLLHCP